MKVAVLYSGVGGANGADYVAEFLANGFRDAGASVSLLGAHGRGAPEVALEGFDFAVHPSGFDLTPERVASMRKACPLVLWTFTDEIGWWRQRIEPVSKLVDIHYSYTADHGFGAHVRLLPLAADPTQYYPERNGYDDDWRDVDVCMIGAKRQYRAAICEGLAKRFPKSVFSWAMAVPVRDIRRLYARTKVVVAPVQDCDEDVPGRAWGCPCRTFDVRSCCAFQLEVERGGLEEAYPAAYMMPPIHDVTKAVSEWGDAIGELLAAPKTREEQAISDYDRTLSYHLYRHRAWKMMQDVRALGSKP